MPTPITAAECNDLRQRLDAQFLTGKPLPARVVAKARRFRQAVASLEGELVTIEADQELQAMEHQASVGPKAGD